MGRTLLVEEGTGAGAVHLTGGTLTVDGVIRANGQGGTGSNDHSGGGGSIWINATNIAGSGTMEARGEDVTAGWAGGGGGAVSIEYTGTSSGTALSNLSARGGTGFAPAPEVQRLAPKC